MTILIHRRSDLKTWDSMKSNVKKVLRSTISYLKDEYLNKGVQAWTSDLELCITNQYNQVGGKERTLDVFEIEIKIDYTFEKYLE